MAWNVILTSNKEAVIQNFQTAMEVRNGEIVKAVAPDHEEVLQVQQFLNEELPDNDWVIEQDAKGHIRITLNL